MECKIRQLTYQFFFGTEMRIVHVLSVHLEAGQSRYKNTYVPLLGAVCFCISQQGDACWLIASWQWHQPRKCMRTADLVCDKVYVCTVSLFVSACSVLVPLSVRTLALSTQQIFCVVVIGLCWITSATLCSLANFSTEASVMNFILACICMIAADLFPYPAQRIYSATLANKAVIEGFFQN